MIGDWQDEWDLKRRVSDRSVNRHDTCRVAAYLNHPIQADVKGRAALAFAFIHCFLGFFGDPLQPMVQVSRCAAGVVAVDASLRPTPF